MKVTAKVTRVDGWWAIQIPEVPGVFTQARRLDQVESQVADAVATMLDLDAGEITVDLAPVFSVEARLERLIAAKTASKEATAAQERASVAMRNVVHELRIEEELSVRDVAALLGVSHQRVSQLAE